MTIRSYNQYCPIAHALDVVGDRWTLLIVRDLALGPKRFTDLAGGLPGIGTNILTARLKELEGDGIIQRRMMPPPAASTVYELTAQGFGLAETLTALVRWGAQTLGPYTLEQNVSQESVMLGVQAVFRPLIGQDIRATYQVEVRAGDAVRTFQVATTPEWVTVQPDAAEQPAAMLQTDIETLYALAGGQLTIAEAHQNGRLHFRGEGAGVRRLVEGLGGV